MTSRLNRFLKYINIIVAAVLVILLVGIYWIAIRPLPKTSGEIEAPLQRTARITRGELSVPHIAAESIADAMFLHGYVHAQDRLWQMDAMRRFGAGELSEVMGPTALELDREARRLRLRRIAEAHYRTLRPEDRTIFVAYARGVNWFIETHRTSLPLEFSLLRYEPRPWSVIDSMLVGLLMFRDLTTTWDDDLQKYTLLAGGDSALVEQLFPVRTGREVQRGSNAWVIGGKLTASGKPILANDPHLEHSIPSKWYMIHLQSPELNVAGVSIPGLPGVIIGHNERIAWGTTNLHFDVQDLYIEKMNLATGQYVFRGAVEQARAERELIAVKGQRPVEFANYVTRHGPLWNVAGAQGLSMKWIAAESGAFGFPFLSINSAGNWQEFRSALSKFPGPAQNFVYADVDGNIGYQVAGMLPVRKNFNGDVPVDGSTGEFEWEGTIPFDALPSSFNPPSGFIVTANQNPFPPDYQFRVGGTFAPHYRAEQIRLLLSAKQGWKPEDMLQIQKDVYSSFLHFIAKQVTAAVDKRGTRDESLKEAAGLLRNWNGQMEKGQPAPFLASLINGHLRTAFAERAAPGKGGLYESRMAPSVVERILRERPDGWFADYDQLLLRVFVDSVEEAQRMQGRNSSKWDYGVYVELRINQPVGSRIPLVGPYFNIGPIPQSGSPTTVKQTTRRVGPSMRFVADLSDWDKSLNNLTTGQSGQFLSWHYKEQWDEYYAGRSFPMPFTKVDGGILTVTPLK